MGKFIDLTGHVYGRLTVLSRAENTARNQAQWNCLCQCKNIAVVSSISLKTGHSSSCGCYRKELRSTQGGGSGTKEHNSWKSMVSRCTRKADKDYCRYGAAGVTVCTEWLSDFQAFLFHIGPKPTDRHSIDRIDNTKGYEPGNVRWATSIEQSANRKNTAMVEYQGVVQPLALLARAHGLAPKVVNSRVVRYGWSVEKALGLST
jgi:hypothetical protein